METPFVFLGDCKHENLSNFLFYADLEGTFTPEEDGFYDFGLTTHGTAQLFIDGKSVIDNTRDQIPGDSFFGAGTEEKKGAIKLKAGESYKVLVKFCSTPTSKMNVLGVTSMGAGGFLLDDIRRMDLEEEISKVVALAKKVDQVIICASLNSDFESEGRA